MKNYEGNYSDIVTQVISDLNSEISGKPAVIQFNPAVITQVIRFSTSANKPDYIIEFKLDDDTLKKYSVEFGLKSGCIKFDDDVLSIVNNYIEYGSTLYSMQKAEELAAREAVEKSEKEAKKAKEKEKAENRRAKQMAALKESNLKKATAFATAPPMQYNEMYVDLGYIAKHCKKIYATLPDYLENWFISQFGLAEHHTTDSSKLNPSGLPSNFSLAITIDLDTNDNLPASLINMLSAQDKKIKPIANTGFGFDICKNFGFQFGKTQNLDKIKRKIPEDKLEDFEFGYNL